MKVINLFDLQKEEGKNQESYEISTEILTKIRTISTQSIFILTGNIVTSIVGYFFTVFVARQLGSEILGLYALGMSLVSLGVIVSTMGLQSAAPRFIGLYTGLKETKKLLAFIRFSMIAITLLSIIFAGTIIIGKKWIAESIFHKDALMPYLPFFGLMIPIASVNMFLSGVLIGYQKVSNRTIVDVYFKVFFKVITSLGLITLGWGMFGWLYGEIGSGIVSMVLLIWLVIKFTPSMKLNSLFGNFDTKIISFAGVLFFIGIITFTWQQISQVILGIFLSAEQVGIYIAAFAVATFIPSILLAVNSIFSPIIAELHGVGRQAELKQLFQTLNKWILGLSWPLISVVIFFSPLIMGIYGEAFKEGWLVLIVIAFGQLVNVGVGSVGIMLIMSGHQRLELIAGVSAAAISIILSLLLIPLLGTLGAGMAYSLGLTIANLIRLIFVYKIMGMSPYKKSAFNILPALIFNMIVVILLRIWFSDSFLPGWGVVILSLAFSFLTFFSFTVIQGLDENDRIVIRSLASQFKNVNSKTFKGI